MTGRGGERRIVLSFEAGGGPWQSIGDPVMGGVSRGELAVEGGVGVFRGVVSLEHGGGFASVRSPEGLHDLSAFGGLSVRVRGDGKTYGLRLRTSSGFDGVNYQADFTAEPGPWRDVELPFAAFEPLLRGRRVAAPPLDPRAIRSYGLIVAGRQAGPFRLEVESISGYVVSSASA